MEHELCLCRIHGVIQVHFRLDVAFENLSSELIQTRNHLCLRFKLDDRSLEGVACTVKGQINVMSLMDPFLDFSLCAILVNHFQEVQT